MRKKNKNKTPLFIPNQNFYTKNTFWLDNPDYIKEENKNEEYRKKLALKSK